MYIRIDSSHIKTMMHKYLD